MARLMNLAIDPGTRFPHPRGDGPVQRDYRSDRASISPPAWGWPVNRATAAEGVIDFPTRVGMARRGLRSGIVRN